MVLAGGTLAIRVDFCGFSVEPTGDNPRKTKERSNWTSGAPGGRVRLDVCLGWVRACACGGSVGGEGRARAY